MVSAGEPSISVIVPAYRAAGTIRRAVDGVLHQTYPAREILVIDDGSPDDLVRSLAAYGSRVRILRQANQGAAAARNRGIDQSHGELIAFLDADDCWEKAKLERQVAVLRAHPRVVLVAGRYFEQAPGQPRREASWGDWDLLDRPLWPRGAQALAVAAHIWTSTVLVRRTALREQRFTPGLEPAEDGDLWIRLLGSGAAYLLREPLATAVLEPSSLSRANLDRSYTKLLQVVRRHRNLLGPQELRRWEQSIQRQWAADGSPSSLSRVAQGPAWNRLAALYPRQNARADATVVSR